MSDTPFLSVITVCFNSGKTIGDTLESLKNQTCDDFESIVIDGGSSDNTSEIVEKFGDFVNTFVSEPDQGIYDAMNKGIKLAKGRYLAFLNSDDAYLPNTISLVRAHARSTWPDIIYGKIKKERLLGREVLTRLESPDLKLMPETMGIFHPATFVHRDLFEQFGPYDLRFKQAADYHWLLRAFLAGTNFSYLEEVLAIFRIGGISNLSCETYREASQIQRELKTGHHESMDDLYLKCLNKQKKNKMLFRLAKWPVLRHIYHMKIKSRWR